MARPEITVHMNVSIDGAIDGAFFGGARGKESGGYYGSTLWELGSSKAGGAITAKKYSAKGKLDLASYEEAAKGLDYSDWRGDVQADSWAVTFDRRGTCCWHGNEYSYGGNTARIAVATTERAPLAYLAFLRHMEIPYVVCGEDEMDLDLAVEKLGALLGIESLVVTGGARINGAFLEAGLVDRISLVVQPYVSGNLERRTAFNTLGRFHERHFSCVQAKMLPDGGVHLLYEADDEPGADVRVVEDVCDPDPE